MSTEQLLDVIEARLKRSLILLKELQKLNPNTDFSNYIKEIQDRLNK